MVGDSLPALRALSLIGTSLTLVTLYFALDEALNWLKPHECDQHQLLRFQRMGLENGGAKEGGAIAAALFVTALTAFHASQIDAARTVRMYSWGTCFAGLSMWLLVRALRSENAAAAARRWSMYGIAVVLFAYTHNFAFFTIGAQAAFVLVLLAVASHRACVRRNRSCPSQNFSQERERIMPNAGFRHSAFVAMCFSAVTILALVFYAPWLPVVLAQAERVNENFWIQPLTWHETQRAVMVWMHGAWIGGTNQAYLWLAILLSTAIWRIVARDSAAIYFLLQALLPWAFTIAVSLFGDRPILQDRYMLFSQVALFAFCGVIFARIRIPALKVGWALLLLAPSSVATFNYFQHLPTESSAIDMLMADVRHEYRVGDMILVSDAATVNVTRYYAIQAGLETVDVRCPVPCLSKGHVDHLSSLTADDMLWDSGEELAAVDRVWVLDTTLQRKGWRVESTKSYSSESGRHKINAALYIRH